MFGASSRTRAELPRSSTPPP